MKPVHSSFSGNLDMKPSHFIGLLSAIAAGTVSLPVPSIAQGAYQQNTQNAVQNATVVGDLNSITQSISQVNDQLQKGQQSGTQDNYQNAEQTAAVVGKLNEVQQKIDQVNSQIQKNPRYLRRSNSGD